MIPDVFTIIEQDGERLVYPQSIDNSQWKEWDHRWLRSLHIDDQNRIISTGFPKFMNLNEGSGRYNVSEEHVLKLAGNDLLATLKIDGSLLIRFVHNGKVRFRTRGSLQVGLENAFEVDEFCKKYPLLADPSYRPNDSLLFEWVSPFNQIVLRYNEAQLFVIGATRYNKGCSWDNARPSLYSFYELNQVSQETGIPLTEHYYLNSEADVQALLAQLKTERAREGFVLRFHGEQELVKVKAQHYIILHALKSHLTTGKLVDLWLSWNQPEYTEFQHAFEGVYDYECWLWASPAVSAMYDGIHKMRGILRHVQQFVVMNKALARKDFALESQSRFNQLRLSACFLFYDGRPIPPEMIKKLVLQNCKQIERRIFES